MIGSAVAALTPAGTHPAVVWAVILGAEIPDIDFVVSFWWGRTGYLRAHRGPTHGILSLLLEAGLIATGLHLLAPTASLSMLYQWGLLGCASHVFFDAGNDYGTQALWPFSRRKLAFDIIPIVDLWVLGVITVAWIATALLPVGRQNLFAGAWLVLAAYVLLRLYLRSKAYRLVADRFDLKGPPADAMPPGDGWTEEPLSIHATLLSLNAWRYVIRAPGVYLTGQVWVFNGRVGEPATARNDLNQIVLASLRAPIVADFAHWVRKPRIQVDREGDLNWVRWSDMRYEVEEFSPFTAYAVLDDQLQLVDEGLEPRRPPGSGRDFVRRRLRHETGR